MQLFTASGGLTQLFPVAWRCHVIAGCDALSGAFIAVMLVFGPWAFGCTETWSIWCLNAVGYCLGALLIAKLLVGRINVRPRRSLESGAHAGSVLMPDTNLIEHRILCTLGTVSILLPTYCFVAAVNARATVEPRSGTLIYHDCIVWLPHSLNAGATWDVFWRLIALICCFWSIRDYLKHGGRANNAVIPPRLADLLWLLILSGGLMAIVGVLQREVHTPKLLFLRLPEVNREAFTQFGPFAYRANAGQYFNLLWPVCLAFVCWWSARSHVRITRLTAAFVCVAALAVVPLISGARGAAIIDLASLLILAPVLLASVSKGTHHQTINGRPGLAMTAAFTGVIVLGGLWSAPQFWSRWREWRSAWAERAQLCDQTRVIARDYPLFGTGPGTFESVYGLYRESSQTYWPAQLHNDWLETRVTFGIAGSALFAVGLGCVLVRCYGLGVGHPLLPGIWVALAGCLIQARWDFPMQVYSIAWLFVFWIAVLFAIRAVKVRKNRDPVALATYSSTRVQRPWA